MKSYTKLQCFLTLFLLCFVNLGYNAKILGLYEAKTVPINEITPIVCCPPEINTTTIKPASISPVLETYSASENRPVLTSSSERHYFNKTDCFEGNPLISNGTAAEPKEFPHMALLGYGETSDDIFWFCGGSLISNRFVLTTANCEKTNERNPMYAKWARLGELDYSSETDDAKPTDYKIVQHIIHPNYKPPSMYHNIALFRLERDVDFSAYVRPICLNTDNIFTPPAIIGTGWGKTHTSRGLSPHLKKVRLNTISAEECDKSFLYIPKKNYKLPKGIDNNSLLCANDSEEGYKICRGDSGGPIQIKHNSYKCMYSQIGIISFGHIKCEDSTSVFTRVSNYISWIEKIVWPKM